MKNIGSIFLAVFFILLILVFYNIDFYSSIIPGWHTTIYPLWKVVLFVVALLIFVLLAIIIFLKLLKIGIIFFSKLLQ
jgi:glucan phosphoethanolaminetransferase (alkaline phosphatase superfamily)